MSAVSPAAPSHIDVQVGSPLQYTVAEVATQRRRVMMQQQPGGDGRQATASASNSSAAAIVDPSSPLVQAMLVTLSVPPPAALDPCFLAHEARLAWTHAVGGRWFVALAAVHAAAPTANTTWKVSDIAAAVEEQQQSQRKESAASSHVAAAAAFPSASAVPPLPLRPCFRSQQVRTTEHALELLVHFHGSVPPVVAVQGFTAAAVSSAAQSSPAASSPSSSAAASLFRLLRFRVELCRCSADALLLLVQCLSRSFDALVARLWAAGGRDLLPHLFVHSELAQIVDAITCAVDALAEEHGLQQETVLAAPHPPELHARLAALVHGVGGSIEPVLAPVREQLSILASLDSSLLSAAHHAATSWCSDSWTELFGFPEGPKGLQAASSENSADPFAWLVRKEVPTDSSLALDVLRPDASLAAHSAAQVAAALQAAAGPGISVALMPPRSPEQSPAASPTAANVAAAFADRPTPLLPLLDAYVLPLLHAGALFLPSNSSSSASPAPAAVFVGTVLSAVLDSFLSFLRGHGVRINGQGAARLNHEARWAWKWMQLRHVRPAGVPASSSAPSSPSSSAVAAAAVARFPRTGSTFLNAAGLHGELSAASLRSWRAALTGSRGSSVAGSWERLAAVAHVLLQPAAYVHAMHSADAAVPAGSIKGRTNESAARKKSAAASVRVTPGTEPTTTWTWATAAPTSHAANLAAAEPSPHAMLIRQSSGVAASSSSPSPFANRVAPMPLLNLPMMQGAAVVSPLSVNSGGMSSPPPSPLPSPSAAAIASFSAVAPPLGADARGLALPDLDAWIALASRQHAKEYAAAVDAAAMITLASARFRDIAQPTVVDWPTPFLD